MSRVMARAKVVCGQSCIIPYASGRPKIWEWRSLSVPLTRILHQSVSSRWIDRLERSNMFAREIRNVKYDYQSFFNFAQSSACLLSNHSKFSKVVCKLYSTKTDSSNLKPKVRRRGLYFLMQSMKIICLITGILLWILFVIALLVVDELKVDKMDKVDIFPSEQWALQRSFKFLDTPEGFGLFSPESDRSSNESEKIQSEITQKVNALVALWGKLKVDEVLQLSLGNTIEIFGYKCSEENSGIWHKEQNEKMTKWVANCYIEGSSGLAKLSILFERHDTESEWVATKLHIEKINVSGEVICNISSSLPNGLKYFTRLSDE